MGARARDWRFPIVSGVLIALAFVLWVYSLRLGLWAALVATPPCAWFAYRLAGVIDRRADAVH
jgi:hypothetical protein